MAVLVVTPPEPLISLGDAKVHLRVTGFDEDQLIESYIAAASSWIDGPTGWLGRCLNEQTLELTLDSFDLCDRLPYGPVGSITSIKYVDDVGIEQTLSDTAYQLAGDRLILGHRASWPSNRDIGGVRIRYVAGGDVLPQVRQAVLLLVGQWFRNRMSVVVGTISSELPFGVEALLSPLRRLA